MPYRLGYVLGAVLYWATNSKNSNGGTGVVFLRAVAVAGRKYCCASSHLPCAKEREHFALRCRKRSGEGRQCCCGCARGAEKECVPKGRSTHNNMVPMVLWL